ncbi:MAG: TetR family transcriptional regulator [Acetobacteraceae bacterium]|nr:TetR family transcriptional regulator [Acetobacteraceae bacterium]
MNAPDPHAATRARIADAAEELFRTLGYQKTAVADIARECGMSPANVYRFYASKSAINEAITQRLLGGLSALVEEIAAGPGTAEERLRATMVEMHRRDIALFFSEKRLHDMVTAAMTEHWGVIERFIERVLGAWADLLREGMERGEFARRDPEATALTLKHLTMLWTHPLLIADCLGRGVEPEELQRDQAAALDLVMAGLKAEPC